MTSIPSNLSRVPNLLASQLVYSGINNTSLQLLNLQYQMSTGLRINRPSDDPIDASTVSVLDGQIETRDQYIQNLSHADNTLGALDSALANLNDILIKAKGVALSQIGAGSDPQTRENQAIVIDAILDQAVNIANEEYLDIQIFGGSATSRTPIVGDGTGLRYDGEGDGMYTDLGLNVPLPITVSAEAGFGALSARMEGERDLDPTLSGATRIVDLNGNRGLGVTLGTVNVDIGGSPLTVDLSQANTVQDVVDTLNTEMQAIDPAITVDIDPATQNRLRITTGVDAITISDPTAVLSTSSDLGLTGTYAGGGAATAAGDVDPRITDLTSVVELTGLTVPLGSLRLENNGQTRVVDLSTAQTVQDIRNIIEGQEIGVRVEISDDGDRLNFLNELSGGHMAISEVSGGTTATELGVRSMTVNTLLDDFNDGLGVQILSGNVDPNTGLPDPARDLDYRVTTKDGTQIDVDLAGAVTVQDVLDLTNVAATAAGLTVGVDFEATLATDGNGIMFIDNTPPGGADTTVERLNGSFAAKDLGILGSTTTTMLVGEDRAQVAVESVFTHLIALREALLNDDERGIELAGQRLEGDIERSTSTRAEVGVRNRRVLDASERQEDLRIKDASLRSQLEDLDYTEAAVQFSLLERQLQAAYTTASQLSNMSLLDFIG